MIPEEFLRCCEVELSPWAEKSFPLRWIFSSKLLCLFLCHIWFSWIALRESKVFHLRKVISSGLALALFPSDSRWKPQDWEHVVWLGESHSAHFWLGEDGHRCLSRGIAAWNEASLYSQIAFLLSLPSSPTSDIFHPLCASSLNSEHLSQGFGFYLQHWADLSLLWGFSLVPTPVLRNSASPGNDMAKALFLEIQKRQESLWHFSKALPEKRCQSKTVLSCNVRSWKVVKELENPSWGEKGNLRSDNLVMKSRYIKAWMDLVIFEWCVHQSSPEGHMSQVCPFNRERPHCFLRAHTSQ